MNNETILLKTVLFGKKTVADPGFPRGGRQPQRWGANLLFWPIFLEKCMILKEIGPRRETRVLRFEQTLSNLEKRPFSENKNVSLFFGI